jgi:signal transduction histidine kinase
VLSLLRDRRILGIPPLDIGLAGILVFTSVGGLLTGQIDETPLSLTVPVAVVTGASILGRTRAPLLAAVVTATANVVQAVAADQAPGSVESLLVLLLLCYGVGVEAEEARAAAGLAVLLLGTFVTEWQDGGSDYVFITVLLGGAWLLGRAARSWRTRARYAEQRQRDLARLAVADERTRIARELHDVVAHSLSVIAVQADAAEAALAKDPDRAGAPLRAIRDSAREALGDMRQLLQVLRTDDADDRSPARGIADLDQLVAGMRAAGVPVEADIRVGSALPPGLGLAVYRIAQEALTNVRKHAGAVPTRLCVDQTDGNVRIQVRNAPPTDPPRVDALSTGHGLVGVRERCRAAGGSVSSGPTDAGGFELVAVLPIEVRS